MAPVCTSRSPKPTPAASFAATWCMTRSPIISTAVRSDPYSAAGIYLDMANSGCRYEQNVVYQTPWPLFPNNWRSCTTSWRENVFLKTGTPPR